MISLNRVFIIIILIKVVLSRPLNKTILIDQYGIKTDSVYIDLESKSIDEIDSETFIGFDKLEYLNLNDNKINRISDGLFKNLKNLRELSLESNNIIDINRNSLIGLNNLELVCFSNNPISIFIS